ncbi:hypothetical protein DY052_09105 [Apilactobacillus timberlakei]|uniref:DUF5776 domain-containing protein n=1 Tax=Apilactobacillus timberlakei TaxID=2008380 RepID=UPI00112E4B92|nr:DUF5776 domain-containing protein [Apilactobacillus timberlakei]TPR12806.1 hypothetical protein DY052_09105 [Apilactobacillus timberlakei]
MKLNKKIATALLVLVPLFLLAVSSNVQSAHAQITGSYTKHESNKQAYEETGMTSAQRKNIFKSDKNVPTHMDQNANKSQSSNVSQKTNNQVSNKKGNENTNKYKKQSDKKVQKHKKNKSVKKESQFYLYKDLKKGRHARIKVLKPMIAHKKISFKHSHADKKIKKNQNIKVIKIKKFKHRYRFQLTNYKFVTANKNFVKLLK